MGLGSHVLLLHATQQGLIDTQDTWCETISVDHSRRWTPAEIELFLWKPLQETAARNNADVLLVAGCPYKIPRHVREHFSRGCVNIHPSWLPQDRGPTPLFWQARRVCDEVAVTYHILDDGWDTGPIICQQRQMLPLGASYEMMDDAVVTLAAEMWPTLCKKLQTPSLWTSQSQREKYQSLPQDHDFRVDTLPAAKIAFHFIRAMGRVYPLWMYDGRKRYRVWDVCEFRSEDISRIDALVMQDMEDNQKHVVQKNQPLQNDKPLELRTLRWGDGECVVMVSGYRNN